jgi:hypothetical protein
MVDVVVAKDNPKANPEVLRIGKKSKLMQRQ